VARARCSEDAAFSGLRAGEISWATPLGSQFDGNNTKIRFSHSPTRSAHVGHAWHSGQSGWTRTRVPPGGGVPSPPPRGRSGRTHPGQTCNVHPPRTCPSARPTETGLVPLPSANPSFQPPSRQGVIKNVTSKGANREAGRHIRLMYPVSLYASPLLPISQNPFPNPVHLEQYI